MVASVTGERQTDAPQEVTKIKEQERDRGR
jgi:hypothetical protein